MWLTILIQIAIAIALAYVSYLLAPKPKQKNAATQDLEAPTSEAGRPIPVIFGNGTLKSPNCLGYWDVSTTTQKVKA